MAHATIEACHVLQAVERAYQALRPPAFQHERTDWQRQDMLLADMRAVSQWVDRSKFVGGRVALTLPELLLIEPYLAP